MRLIVSKVFNPVHFRAHVRIDSKMVGMRLQFKLLLCFVLISMALPIVGYVSVVNDPKINRVVQLLEESHQETLFENRLLIELYRIDGSLQEIQKESFRMRGNIERQNDARKQQAIDELYSSVAAFKRQYSLFKQIQASQWETLSRFENLKAPDESERQEQAFLARVEQRLPTLEKNIETYLRQVGNSADAGSDLLQRTLSADLREELLPSLLTASDATEKRMQDEAGSIELGLTQAYKRTIIAVVASLLLSIVLAVGISRSVADPIHRLGVAAKQIGQGDFSTHVEVRDHGEVSELAKAFNQMGANLQEHVAQRLQAKEALEQVNQKLSISLGQLQVRSSESSLASEMANMLQSCVNLDEAGQVLVRSLQRALPHTSGALFLFSASRNLVEAIAAWGDSPPKESVFPPGDCWALRRGSPYTVLDSKIGMPCVHLNQDAQERYMCIPLSAQGDTLGVFHVRTDRADADLWESSPDHVQGSVQRLSVTLAEQAALALANLKLRDTLKHQSIRDPLTGLFNRRYMEDSLERELRRSSRTGRPLSVFMLDLDHFKRFNDTFGHEAGDVMLREVAYYMQKRMRGEDIICRYGGEEFVVILCEAPLEMAQKRAGQILEGARQILVLQRGQSLGGITLSIGIASFPEHGSTVDVLLRGADQALYRAKEQGRDRYVTADVPMVHQQQT